MSLIGGGGVGARKDMGVDGIWEFDGGALRFL